MSVGKNITFGGWLLTTSLLVVAPLAAANDLDVTMRMVEDSEDLTNSVTREIRLPELPVLQRKAGDQGRARPDDNFINQEVAKHILEREGAVVALAGDGQEAVDVMRERGRDFGQSVSERAREAREKKPEPAIDRLPQPALDARERKPDMPPQSSRP